MDWEGLRAELKGYGQEHLLLHLDQLDQAEKASLYADIKSVDFQKVSRLWKEAHKSLTENGTMKDDRLKPLDSSIVGSTSRDRDVVSRWSERGRWVCKWIGCGSVAQG